MLDWSKIKQAKIAAIETPLCDRLWILAELSERIKEQEIYFWNKGYKQLNRLSQEKIVPTDKLITGYESAIDYILSVAGVLILEGIGPIDSGANIAYQLANFYFDSTNASLILIDSLITIPANLYPLISQTKIKLPSTLEIERFIEARTSILDPSQSSLQNNLNPSSYNGLSFGEIDSLLRKEASHEMIMAYKTQKLASLGLRITPAPDVPEVGGLDLLLRDLNKIKKLFTSAAQQRGLSPPKGCLLWGLPGTGKSLVAKMLSSYTGATLISCDWNQLISFDLSESLQNLDWVLQLVDNSGPCVLFFDEFEKAFFGWNSTSSGGVLSKLAGKLLSWMQDHASPSIMVATINRLDMLPPELVRRFDYIWFFDSLLHNGAMYEVFKLHLAKHFPGFWEQFDDENWYKLFVEYRLCSPAEIAGAIKRVHDEIFYLDLHHELTSEILLEQLIIERNNFKPAFSNKSISNALAEISHSADFARPVRGVDRSRFSVTPRRLFEEKKSQLPEDYTPAI